MYRQGCFSALPVELHPQLVEMAGVEPTTSLLGKDNPYPSDPDDGPSDENRTRSLTLEE